MNFTSVNIFQFEICSFETKRSDIHTFSERVKPFTLRRWSRGMPFLPLGGGDAEQFKGTTVPGYLCEFLARLGVRDIPVYNSLDGRMLVHFQAALWQLSEPV